MESAELAPLASFEELKQGFPTLPFSLAKVPSISKLAADKASVGRVSSPRLCPTFAFCCSSLDGWQDSQLLGLGIKPWGRKLPHTTGCNKQTLTNILYIRDVCSTTCWNNLQDLWERSPRFVGIWARKKSPRFVGIISKICGNVGEKKNPQDLWARFSSLYPRKKIHKICGRDFHKIF